MKTKKQIKLCALFSIIICLYSNPSNSQTADQNLSKYWYLKHRLINHFMVVGPSENMSYPAGGRNYLGTKLDFGDSPNFLSKYIGILATEYRLLKDNYQSTDATVRELFYALYALNRLDLNEGRYPFDRSDQDGNIIQGRKDELNGFFNRDDNYTRNSTVRPNSSDPQYNSYFAKINNNLIPTTLNNDPGNAQEVDDFAGGLDFEYSKTGTIDDIREDQDGVSMSQDHLSSVLVGMALIKNCLDDNVTFGSEIFKDGKQGIKEESVEITKRIMEYMFYGPKPYNSNLNVPFVLLEPDGDKIGRGPFAIWYSYGFASTADYICGGIYYRTLLMSSTMLAEFLLLGPGAAGFNPLTIWQQLGSAATVMDRLTLIGNMAAAMGINLGDLFDQTGSEWILLNLACVGEGWTLNQDVIYEHSAANSWQEYYPLLHAVLHNRNCKTSESYIETVLGTMPCGGNYKIDSSTLSVNWATNHRWQNNSYENIHGSWFTGKFPALDWMILFNLYALNQNGAYIANYHREFNEYKSISGIFPYVQTDANLIGNSIRIIGSENYTGTTLSNAFFNTSISGAPYYARSFGDIVSDAVIENKSFNQSYQVYLINPVYNSSNNLVDGILNWFIEAVNNNTAITINLNTPVLQADVTFKAANSVRLTTGFHAKAGVKFHALVEPIHCNASGTGYEKLASGGKEPLGNQDVALASLDKGVMYNPSGQNTEQQNIENVNTLNTSNKNTTQTKQQSYNDNAFSIAPNPNSGVFEVKYNKTQGAYDANVNVSIADVTGRIVWSSLTENNKGDDNNLKWDVNLVKFSKGIYSVKLQDGSTIKTGKIVVQ